MKQNLKFQLKLDQKHLGINMGDNGMIFGIDEFGKSAPYKKIFEYFGLSTKNNYKNKK